MSTPCQKLHNHKRVKPVESLCHSSPPPPSPRGGFILSKRFQRSSSCPTFILEFRNSYTDKKEKKFFLIYKEIQSGAVAKSYMRKGFLIYMRKYANISPYMRKAASHIWLCNCSTLNYLIYEENLLFFFISVESYAGPPAPLPGI